MIGINMVQFILQLLVAGFLLRYAQVKLLSKDSELGKALAFIY